MQLIYYSMNIPQSCKVGSTIFKKLFYENVSLNKQDKIIFTNHIKKILWQYSFREDTLNIQPYFDETREYEEIAILEVQLKNNIKVKRISEIIQRAIPYPLILVFIYENSFLLNVAHKRCHKIDESKNMVEELVYTDWINVFHLAIRERQFLDDIDIENYSFKNFYQFYTDFVERIYLFNASVYNNDYLALKEKEPKRVKKSPIK